MSTNLRTEKFLSSVIPAVGLAWATRRPRPQPEAPAIVIEPTADGWVIDAADALALAWASRR